MRHTATEVVRHAAGAINVVPSPYALRRAGMVALSRQQISSAPSVQTDFQAPEGAMSAAISDAASTTSTIQNSGLYYEEKGAGTPILLIHPAGGSASTWGSVVDNLERVGRVIAYDRRGYARSGGNVVHSIRQHTMDAAALLDSLEAMPAVVVGASVGATIAIDLAIRRPDAVRSVVAYEASWGANRYMRRHPDASALKAIATAWWLDRIGRTPDATTVFLRWAYSYTEGGSAWDAFPEEWRRVARENAQATHADVQIATGDYPEPKELATITAPTVCAYGARSRAYISRMTRSLVGAIPTARLGVVEGAAHAVAFDAPAAFARLIADEMGYLAGRRQSAP